MQTSCSEVHLRKASCSMIRKFRGRLSCCSCEQYAKVEPKISMTSVWDKSTVCSCWQLTHAADPILLNLAAGIARQCRLPGSSKHRFGYAGLHPDFFQVEVTQGRASLKHSRPQLCLGGWYIARALSRAYLCWGAALLKDLSAEMFAARGCHYL